MIDHNVMLSHSVRCLGLFFLMVSLASPVSASERAPLVPRKYPPLVTAQTDEAIRKGLTFLVSVQHPDGAFRENGHYGTYPVAMTALAGLAISGSGSTPTQGKYSPQIRKLLTFLLESSQRNGLICRPGEEASRSMYGHGFSMLFLAQAMGMEENKDRLGQIGHVLKKGVRLSERSQSRLGGWLYTPDMSGDEGSVTITQVQALRAARNAGVAVPKQVIDRAMRYLEKSVQPDGGIAYRVGMLGSRPPITAAAVACWFNAGQYDNPMALRALAYCKTTIDTGRDQRGTYGHWSYAHLYLAQVMYLRGGEDWGEYYPKIRETLLAAQQADGSWEGDAVGNVYGTAIALIILQLPYNNLPIMQR